MPTRPTQLAPHHSASEQLLSRPPRQRLQEFKYRCAQSIVFGLPVLFLHYFGQGLGGPEAARWTAIFQALLAGWVMYVGAAGMLCEGVLRLRSGPPELRADLVISLAAVFMYLWSLISVLGIAVVARPWYGPLLFHASVVLIGVWTAVRWYRLRTVTQS